VLSAVSASTKAFLQAVREMLLYHVARGRLTSADLDEGPLPTLKEDNIDVSLAPIRFNQAGVSQADITSCNTMYVLPTGIVWTSLTTALLRPAST
jgi:uncharacterized surface protein with fasciclin (FAS1) repeats